MRLKEKVAIVTAAAYGIGAEISRTFAREGWIPRRGGFSGTPSPYSVPSRRGPCVGKLRSDRTRRSGLQVGKANVHRVPIVYKSGHFCIRAWTDRAALLK